MIWLCGALGLATILKITLGKAAPIFFGITIINFVDRFSARAQISRRSDEDRNGEELTVRVSLQGLLLGCENGDTAMALPGSELQHAAFPSVPREHHETEGRPPANKGGMGGWTSLTGEKIFPRHEDMSHNREQVKMSYKFGRRTGHGDGHSTFRPVKSASPRSAATLKQGASAAGAGREARDVGRGA